MNTSTKIFSSALIAIASLSAASAFASGDSEYPGVQTNTASTMTRAQVRAELMQAKRQGTLIQSDENYPGVVAQDNSVKTREEVKAELNNALQHGLSLRIDNSYPENAAS